jgi:hypothetical protein
MKKIVQVFMVVLFILSAVPAYGVQAHPVGVTGFLDQYPVEEVTGYLMTDRMPVMVFPLNADFFYSYFSDYRRTVPSTVRTYELSGVELGYKNLYLAPDPGNPKGLVRYVVFYHTTGTKLLAVGIYDRGELDSNGKYVPSVKYYTNDVRTSISAPGTDHTILGDFYPNKVINDLEAAQSILDYQAVNGPFLAGVEYSMLDLLDLHAGSGYLLGKTSTGELSIGGGVCVMATNWFKMQVLAGATFVEHWQHPTHQKYFENPVGSDLLSIAETDATVQGPDYDLRWVQHETGWVSISVSVLPGGDKVQGEYGDADNASDALLIITMRFTKAKPDLSVAKIESLQNAYIAYRKGPAGMAALADGSRLMAETPWQRGDSLSSLLAKLVPEERVSRFASELANDPFLKSLVLLRSTANSVSPTSDTLVGTFLKNSEWYAQEVARLGNTEGVARVDAALRHLNANSNFNTGQKVQCFGLVILMSSMDTRFVPIGGAPIVYAADLVPQEIRNGNRQSVGSMTGGVVKTIQTIDEVMVGDIGVRYDTTSGHVFAVVGKKVVSGQTVLLLISANQRMDGQITIFEVDNSNFDVVFGIPAWLKVVIRK